MTYWKNSDLGLRNRRVYSVFAFLCGLIIALLLANICLGSASLSLGDVWSAFFDRSASGSVITQIVLEFRLPRAVTAFLAGSALAVAGLLMQTIFRNPLADPFVLGVNSGASLGVAIVLLALAPAGVALTQDLGISGHVLVVFAATGGSAVVLAVVLIFAQRVDTMSLLILGLMLSYAVGAVVSILMFYSMAERIQSFFSWSYGSFGNVTWTQMQVFGVCISGGVLLSGFLCKALDAMLLGERLAESLGTQVKWIRIATLGLASLLAGTVTGFCGPIGFLGIAAPHLTRFLFKTAEHRILLPATGLIGGAMALGADLVAKAPGFESTLPLNAITALVGAPMIISALVRQRSLRKVFG